jgi:hypothetical protein
MIGKARAAGRSGGRRHRRRREQDGKRPTDYRPSQKPTYEMLAHNTLLLFLGHRGRNESLETNRLSTLAREVGIDGRIDN